MAYRCLQYPVTKVFFWTSGKNRDRWADNATLRSLRPSKALHCTKPFECRNRWFVQQVERMFVPTAQRRFINESNAGDIFKAIYLRLWIDSVSSHKILAWEQQMFSGLQTKTQFVGVMKQKKKVRDWLQCFCLVAPSESSVPFFSRIWRRLM
jgi:hypothetical protein